MAYSDNFLSPSEFVLLLKYTTGSECEQCLDDFVNTGAAPEQHDGQLRLVLERCRKLNLKLNLTKCKFGQTQIPYLGQVLSAVGIKPDQATVDAIHSAVKNS